MDYIEEMKTFGERLDGRSGKIAPATIFGLYKILRAMLNKSLSTTMISLRALNTSRKEGVEALSNTYQQLMDKKLEDEPEDKT